MGSRGQDRRESVTNFAPQVTGVAMESDTYNDLSVQQCEGVENVLPNLTKALEAQSMDEYFDQDQIVVADFGVSGGKACIKMVKKVQECRGAGVRTILYLNDRPENDWEVTCATIDEGLGDSITRHCLAKDMYTRQDIAEGSLHIAWSNNSLQWLSTTPSEFTTGTFAAQRLRSDPHRVLWAKQAKKDLHNFCVNRAFEMAPGGVLLISFPCLNYEDCPDQIRCSDAVFAEAKNILILEGVLTEDDEKTLVIPEYYRSEQEVREVLNSKEMRELWQVKEIDSTMIKDPWVEALNKGNISKKKCAEMQKNATRSYNETFVRAKIRSEEKRKKFWNVLEGLCLANPNAASHTISIICIVLQRKNGQPE